MRVCVTGGTGFVGRALVRRLLAAGNEVRVLARPSPRADELAAQGAAIISGNLNDAGSIERAVTKTDVVYHVAAKTGGAGARRDFFEANVQGTERILTESLRAGVSRVIYASSIAVYGPVPAGERINEHTPCDAAPERRDFYAQSKIAADELIASFASKTGLPAVLLRPGFVYGRGKSLPLGLLGFRCGWMNFVFGNRRNRVPLIYVENLVDAMLLAGNTKGERTKVYVIVDDENLTLEQYHAVKSAIDHTHTVYLPGWPVRIGGPLAGLPAHQVERALRDRWYDTRRIREELGWTPRVLLAEAIRETLAG